MFSLMLLLVLLMSGCSKEEVGKDVPVTPSEPSPPSAETPSFKDNHYAVLYNDNGWDESTFLPMARNFI